MAFNNVKYEPKLTLVENRWYKSRWYGEKKKKVFVGKWRRNETKVW